jgi:hypothetical protein
VYDPPCRSSLNAVFDDDTGYMTSCYSNPLFFLFASRFVEDGQLYRILDMH